MHLNQTEQLRVCNIEGSTVPKGLDDSQGASNFVPGHQIHAGASKFMPGRRVKFKFVPFCVCSASWSCERRVCQSSNQDLLSPSAIAG